MGYKKQGLTSGKGGPRPSGDELLTRLSAIVPDSAKIDPMPLPTREQINNVYDPMQVPIVAIGCYLRLRGTSRVKRKWFDLFRPPYTIFRGGDSSYGANLANLSALFDAGFNRGVFEAANPDIKAKVDAAMAALEAA